MSSIEVLRHIVKEQEHVLQTIHGVDLQTELLELFGKQLEITKAALQSKYTVPWVLNCQSKDCMRCDKMFGMLRWRHHCRQCGFLVCHGCSPSLTLISELNENKGSRTCKTCVGMKSGSIVDVYMKKEPSSPESTKSFGTDPESIDSM